MPNENVVKIRMDKPMFGVFFFFRSPASFGRTVCLSFL